MKAAILGHFGEGVNLLNGQTVKTKIITEALQSQLGQEQVLKIDTHGGWINILKAPFQTLFALKNSENVLIFPAQNGLRVYVPLLFFQRYLLKNRKIHYVVIGGWLPKFLKSRRILKEQLKTFDGIYVETQTMKRDLQEQGFTNIHVMPNCKKLTVLSPEELVYEHQEPYKLCTFSRVMQEKGIEDAVRAVEAVNAHFGRTVYTLDIFGQIDPGQVQWFRDLQSTFTADIRYGGLVPFDKSVEVLKDYFALLFPTRFYTEGIPGTIIDAYAAGVPAIAVKWESFSDVLEDGATGYVYAFGSQSELEGKLIYICQNSEKWISMRRNCLEEAKKYTPEKVISIMIDRL